jgi:hypothetical protein
MLTAKQIATLARLKNHPDAPLDDGADSGSVLPAWAWWRSSSPTPTEAGLEVLRWVEDYEKAMAKLEAVQRALRETGAGPPATHEIASEWFGFVSALVGRTKSAESALSNLRAYFTRSIADDLSMDEAVMILDEMDPADRAAVDKWVTEMENPAYFNEEIAEEKAAHAKTKADLDEARSALGATLGLLEGRIRPADGEPLPIAMLAVFATLTTMIEEVPEALNFMQDGWTWTADDGSLRTYKVLVQRGEGKTPADICTELARERDVLATRLEAVRHALGEDAPSITDPPDVWARKVGMLVRAVSS